ncbi:MAG: phosphoenolpyruvate--protein phosphotransferase [bacterium]
MDHIKLLCDIGELTEIFSESTSIESFLQKIVIMVAHHMETDVCSIYLYDEEKQLLVLKATHGLKADAVGKVALKAGEGLVGLALKESLSICEKVGSSHPNFKLIEGIFEERFESFLAVPILRGISKIGVLVVQREKKRCFGKEDAMALRIAASQLAGIIEQAKLLMTLRQKHESGKNTGLLENRKFIRGKVASEGFALAGARVLAREKYFEFFLQEDFDDSYTLDDFNQAVKETEQQLKDLQASVEEKLADTASLIFTAHLLILKDRKFTGGMTELMKKGESPPRAVIKVAQKYMKILSQSTNPYIREKVQDLKDLAVRLMRNLLSDRQEPDTGKEQIVIAEELFPSDILKLSSEGVSGIILVTGGVTSHLSILARSLQIPMIIVDLPELLTLPQGTMVLLDAELGNIYLEPSEEIMTAFKARNDDRAGLSKRKRRMKDHTVTKDGLRVKLLANINLLTDLKLARELHAEGVGLYRTEFPFLIRSTFPSEEEQFVVYRKLIEGMPGKVITFRTLDIGGDKVLSYYRNTREENPFLGMRSIRFSLRNKDIFVQQIRAMLRAGKEADMKIMFPMISSVDELQEAKRIVFECVEALQKENIPHHERPAIGMMVEIPSVLEILDELAQEADFFCIGTNDFIQYMLAVDRTNEKVADFYLPYHPSVLRSIKKVVETATRHGLEVSICGDMAHDERYLPYLLGIGLRIFSLNPFYLPKIQQAISKIAITEATKAAESLMSHGNIRDIARIL